MTEKENTETPAGKHIETIVVTVNSEQYNIEKHFLLGIAVTASGIFHYIDFWTLPQNYLEMDTKEEDPVVSVLPVKGYTLEIWHDEAGDRIGYEIDGEVFDAWQSGTHYETYEGLVSEYITHEDLKKMIREQERERKKNQ